MPGGDYGVGYAFAWFIYTGGFMISTGLLAWNMNLHRCFDWMSTSFLRHRHWLVFLGWISFTVAIIWSLESRTGKNMNEFPTFMHLFTRSRVYIWLPLLLLIPGLYFLNAPRIDGFAPSWARIIMITGFSVSLLVGAGIFWTFGKFWIGRRLDMVQWNIANKMERLSDYQSAYKAAFEKIKTYDEPTIAGLLKYAVPENDRKLKDAATAKLKSFNNWEQDLIGILTIEDLENIYVFNDDTYYVYAFMIGNKVEHPELFLKPIQYSLKVLTNRVTTCIEDPYCFELGRIGVEVVGPALEAQFKDRAIDFRPYMLKLQEALALQAPERMNKQRLKSFNRTLKEYRLVVKNWLESNK